MEKYTFRVKKYDLFIVLSIWLLLPIIIRSVYAEPDNALTAYTTSIRQKIINNLIYPQQIQLKVKNETITLSFIINEIGEAEKVKIIKSSGSSLVDKITVEGIYKAEPFPPPKQIGRESLPILLSFKISPNTPLQESEKDIKNYKKWVRQKVSKYLLYPSIAKRNKWEGIVTLNVKINSDGRVEKAEIVIPSGYPILDRAAIEAVYRASPYPFPDSIKQPYLTLALPFNFKLSPQDKYSLQSPKYTPEQTQTAVPLNEYINKVRKRINQMLILPSNLETPKEAIVQFIIDEKGEVENLTIKKSSGSSAVDKAAKEAIYRAERFPSPRAAGKHSIQISLPIKFDPSPIKLTSSPKSSPQKTSGEQSKKLSKHRKKRNSHITTLSEEENNMYEPDGNNELKNLVKTAVRNSKPLEIAGEEMKLANIKLIEAKRNLWPSITLGFYHTKGEVYNLDYREQESKISINQPLYYGGQLTNAVKQAEVNIEITKRNYVNKKIETINKTEVAYFNLIALYQNLREQKSIVNETQKILQAIDEQYKNGLVIKLDYNEAHSWYKQLTLQLKSIEQEIGLAKLSLKQVLNTKTLPKLSGFSMGIKKFNFTLDDCVNLALKYRPEVKLGRLMVKFYEYAKKVEEGKTKFNVGLIGSYGHYQGGYKTEPLKPADNWGIGIRITKPWGPNTIATTYDVNNEQPRFGETSPTKTDTVSTELKMFDNYKMKADLKNAKIMYLKSTTQLQETKKSIIFEVENNFFKYKKALLQLKSALSQKRFREEELKITRMRALAGEAKFVHLVDILVQFADAENKYAAALGNYYIAIANLRKATGYGLHIPL